MPTSIQYSNSSVILCAIGVTAISLILIIYGVRSIWKKSSIIPGSTTRLNYGAFMEAFTKSRPVSGDSAVAAGYFYILAGSLILLLYLLTFLALMLIRNSFALSLETGIFT